MKCERGHNFWDSHSELYFSRRGAIDLEAKFEPNLLNTAIYLLGLSQQVSTFAINFQVFFRLGVASMTSTF